jgi:hypothetical protein
MGKAQRPKVSPFRLATREPAVLAEIGVDDVMEARPGWSRQQASDWLSEHTDALGEAMVLAGGHALVRLLGGGGDA